MLRNTSAPHPLDGPWRKIEWAGHHLDVMHEALETWRSLHPSGPHGFSYQLHAYEGLHVYRIEARVEPLPRIGLAVSDFAHSLRSALDQIVWALSDTEALSERERRRIQFPILEPPRNDHVWRTSLQGIDSPAILDVIERFQPYRNGHSYRGNALWVLNEINRIDKHRTLTVAKGFGRIPLAPGIYVRSGTIDHGDVLAIAELWTEPDIDLEPHLTFDEVVEVGDPGDLVRVPLRSLVLLHQIVRNEVFPAFVPFFPPRGS